MRPWTIIGRCSQFLSGQIKNKIGYKNIEGFVVGEDRVEFYCKPHELRLRTKFTLTITCDGEVDIDLPKNIVTK